MKKKKKKKETMDSYTMHFYVRISAVLTSPIYSIKIPPAKDKTCYLVI